MGCSVLLLGCSSSDPNDSDSQTNVPVLNTSVSGSLDSDSVSISTDVVSINAASVDGNTATLTFRTGDNLNDNAVPDGLEVRFIAEGGAVTPSCFLTDGACEVTWIGQSPRPIDFRSTILAYTLGNESFLDTNANGLFDDGDLFDDIPARIDVPEPFLDANDNGTYDMGTELFIDNPNSGIDNVYDLADGLYSGPACAHSTLCANHQNIFVFDSAVLVMSEGQVSPTYTAVTPASGVTAALNDGSNLAFSFTLEDANSNALPSNTPITISIDSSIGTVFSGGNQVFPATQLGPTTFNAILTGAEFDPLDPPDPGQIIVTVEMEGISYLFTTAATLSP